MAGPERTSAAAIVPAATVKRTARAAARRLAFGVLLVWQHAKADTMADLILACQRPGRRRSLSGEDLLRVAARVAPTNIAANPARLLETTGLRAVVVNPSPDGVRVREGAVCLGGIFGEAGEWWRTGSEAPDGTYAMLRYSEATVELLSDAMASRTIWYVVDDEAFLASTSQRALVALLGDLQVNPAAVSWLMSSGTLGPESSWDTRLSRLPGCSRLTFDRGTWRARVETRQMAFATVARDRQAHVSMLRGALAWSCANLNIDVGQWVLPLSGGRDSRALLAFMVENGLRPRCITWTTRASRRRPLSDAFIAPLVARRFGVEHEFVWLDGHGEEPAVALDRFIAVVEGRSDEFAGYTDGCRIWRDLFDSGVSGVIRGDESAGIRRRAASPEAARSASAGAMVHDYPATHLIRRLGLAEQEWPERLRQQPGEGLKVYRDRIYEQSYLPGALAPLNDLKGRYVEVVNPLLSRRMIGAVHELPEELRAYGRAYAKVVDGMSRPIPYARFTSTTAVPDYLGDPGVIEAVVRELSSPRVERVFGREEAVLRLLAAMAAPQWRRPTLRSGTIASLKIARVALPLGVARRLTPRYGPPEPLSPARLAFRAALASRTLALLDQDAALLAR